MSSGLAIGAPGIYELSVSPLRELTGVRMDVAAFVGVAPRGPAREPVDDRAILDDASLADLPWVDPARPRRRTVPVAVESWDDYRRLFGGFEGEGLLPYAVASFFEQGGTRAYVARIVHDYRAAALDAGGVAAATLRSVGSSGGPVRLHARNEGSWGNRLGAALSFRARPLPLLGASTDTLTLAPDDPLPGGSLVRLTLPGGTRVLRFVVRVSDDPRAREPRYDRHATLDRPCSTAPVGAEMVEGSLEVVDADPAYERVERHQGVGLAYGHPRWLGDVLSMESELVLPDPAWAAGELLPASADLADAVTGPFEGGEDRENAIVPEDFFDDEWVLGDEFPRNGVHSLVCIADVSLVLAPDLYSPGPLAPLEHVVTPVSLAGPDFATCVVPPPVPVQDPALPPLTGLRLEPELPDDLRRITELQARLVGLADQLGSFVVLLDVPPRLSHYELLAWRAALASSFAAVYHPWLRVSQPADERNTLVAVNPSAVAAGIAARLEHERGVMWGPFNTPAAGVVDVDERVSPSRHDELHPLGVNVFLKERDAVRLAAGRTLSRDPAYRQLSIRRLVTMLHRALEQQMQWTVFEPNDEALRSTLRHMLESFLRELWYANAFTGATEAEAFFVRCDESLNPPAIVDEGRLIVELGIAPAEPLEFLLLRLDRDGDGTVRVEGARG